MGAEKKAEIGKLSGTVGAYVLSHPVRTAIVRLLKEKGDMYTSKIAAELGLSDRLAAFHLSMLASAGFVTSEYRLTNPGNPPRVARYFRVTPKVKEALDALCKALE